MKSKSNVSLRKTNSITQVNSETYCKWPSIKRNMSQENKELTNNQEELKRYHPYLKLTNNPDIY